VPADTLEAGGGGVVSSEQLRERVYEPYVDQLLEAGGEAGTTQCRRRQHLVRVRVKVRVRDRVRVRVRDRVRIRGRGRVRVRFRVSCQHRLPGGSVGRGHARQLCERDGGAVVPCELVRVRVRVRVVPSDLVTVRVRVRVGVGPGVGVGVRV